MSLPRNVEKRLIIFNGLKKREISDTGQQDLSKMKER